MQGYFKQPLAQFVKEAHKPGERGRGGVRELQVGDMPEFRSTSSSLVDRSTWGPADRRSRVCQQSSWLSISRRWVCTRISMTWKSIYAKRN